MKNGSDLKRRIKEVKRKGVLLMALVFFTLYTSNPVFAALVGMEKTSDIFTGNIVIAQERYQVGSVLVSKPREVDLEILDIICKERIKTIEDYTKWLQKNVEYKKDEGDDTWSLPKETLERGCGDCEDIAFLNAEFLRVLGYKPKVIAILGGMRRKGEGHAICAFKKDGRYFWFDNTKLKESSMTSIKGFSFFILRNYLCTRLVDINPDTKKQAVLCGTSE